MCGITGWIHWKKDLTKENHILSRMTEALHNRGPDDYGYWISPRAALGHRRLVVVDPEGGIQPMTRKRGKYGYTIVYNGELYNTLGLRKELQGLGYQFESRHSDTETLLTAFMEWGADSLLRLNGIFAFAVFDELEQSLFLARDRLGVKPLFYYPTKDGLLFASEPKSILIHPEVTPAVEAEGLAEIFVMGPSRTPGHGVFKGMYEVKQGHYIICNRETIQKRRYWQLKSKVHRDDLEGTVRRVKYLLRNAVERQLVSDVGVCTLLSGGLDSTALTAFAADAFKKNDRGPLHTFSIDYEDNDDFFLANSFQPDSDSKWVDYASDYLGTVHHRRVVKIPDLTESLMGAMRARDLPGMADVDSSLYLFCKEIKKKATVALSGEAADEIFGGYPWFHNEESLNSDSFPWIRSLKDRLKILSPDLVSLIQPEDYLRNRYQETLAEVPILEGEEPLEARRREIFYLNIIWFMTTLLDRKDRMSMAHGLEVRVPFCDHRLVEYVWNIPWSMKTCGGREKGILRNALSGVVPPKIIERKKSPYPKTHNPAYTKILKKILTEKLADHNSPLLPLVNSNAMFSLLKMTKDEYGIPWFGQLMSTPQLYAYYIQLDSWLREYRIKIC
ncbi:asparagine synthase (glutamine-hydrolyzing) [Candidatus Contubernalis alkaliaceticus]|uniref:asparagine synthase (glutamine-hydrolyzing) n=1 Tax=Candidatus Contubernalis alkaliaceticus TaxID=338645 RepID=UPI001F4C22C1|nr:asparagine synthase (glutamine-hydrolyzing) [Candidatus Contubernalis alkalaceticus]UNC92246.1 asparagine synthase (glutamine-hydrolyzing) [Candidatus Contubernalis alkalaceticus]